MKKLLIILAGVLAIFLLQLAWWGLNKGQKPIANYVLADSDGPDGGGSGSGSGGDFFDKQGTVKMSATVVDQDLFKITVKAQDMSTPVFGFSFDLEYLNDVLKFVKYEPGDFLERGGTPFYLVKSTGISNAETPNEKIVFGETLKRGDSFPVGNGNVANFYFKIDVPESGENFSSSKNFSFKFKNGVVSTLDTARRDIPKINWEDAVFQQSVNFK